MISNKSDALPAPLKSVPKASEEAIAFLESLTLEMLGPLSGKEELDYISTLEADQIKVGTLNFSLQSIPKNVRSILKVSETSNYKVNEVVRTKHIISNMTSQAKLIEQHVETHLKAKYHLLREMNVVQNDELLIFVNDHSIDGRLQTHTSFRIDPPDEKGFIPLGLDIILLKLFARLGGVPNGQLTFVGVDSSNYVVPITYTNLPRTKLNVSDAWVEVFGFERKTFGQKFTEIERLYLDEAGNLLLMICVGQDLHAVVPTVKKLKRVPDIFTDERKGKRRFDWEKDLEMISIFEYLKEKSEGELTKFNYKNPSWKNMIADFLQQLLIDKPSDVLTYAADYFSNFASNYSNNKNVAKPAQ